MSMLMALDPSLIFRASRSESAITSQFVQSNLPQVILSKELHSALESGLLHCLQITR